MVVTGASGARVLIGVLRSTDYDTVDKIKYEFRVFESTDHLSSLDVKVSERKEEITKTKKGLKPRKRLPVVDVVVGDVKGSIFRHNDLWANLVEASSSMGIIPQKLHWHRKAVHALTWSLDGLYNLPLS